MDSGDPTKAAHASLFHLSLSHFVYYINIIIIPLFPFCCCCNDQQLHTLVSVC